MARFLIWYLAVFHFSTGQPPQLIDVFLKPFVPCTMLFCLFLEKCSASPSAVSAASQRQGQPDVLSFLYVSNNGKVRTNLCSMSNLIKVAFELPFSATYLDPWTHKY